MRNSLPSIARGSYATPFVSGQIMGYQRKWGSEQTLVLINYGTHATTAVVNGLTPSSSLALRLGTGGAISVGAGGSASVPLPAQSVAVYQILP